MFCAIFLNCSVHSFNWFFARPIFFLFKVRHFDWKIIFCNTICLHRLIRFLAGVYRFSANEEKIPDFIDWRYGAAGCAPSFDFRVSDLIACISRCFAVPPRRRDVHEKPGIRGDYDGARISLSRKSAPRSVRYTLLRSTANSILVNIVFIEQRHKIRIIVRARKHLRFSLRKTLGHIPAACAHLFIYLPSRLSGKIFLPPTSISKLLT